MLTFENAQIIFNLESPINGENSLNSEFMKDLMRGAFDELGIIFKVNNRKNAFTVGFRDIQAFEYYHQSTLVAVPFEHKENDIPYRVRVSYEKIPEGYTLQQIVELSSKPYKIMNVSVIEIPGTDVYEMVYPNEQAYFIILLQTFLHVEKTLGIDTSGGLFKEIFSNGLS